jgi:hypothetical protein
MTFKNIRKEKKLALENENIGEFPKSQDVKLEAQMPENFKGNGRMVKRSYCAEFLFIGRGGSFEKISRYNHCTTQNGMSVHSDVSRVTFLPLFEKFSWKRIVGVNPLPRGASVGELGKNISPSNLRRYWDSHKFCNVNEKGSSSAFCSVISE